MGAIRTWTHLPGDQDHGCVLSITPAVMAGLIVSTDVVDCSYYMMILLPTRGERDMEHIILLTYYGSGDNMNNQNHAIFLDQQSYYMRSFS